jgi:formylglycine-generating enzyme required for sulfatase activity
MSKTLSYRLATLTMVALAGGLAAVEEPPQYVPVKMDAKEAAKRQADWAAKLKVEPETKSATGVRMVLIPPAGEALPDPYWIGKYEVTQGEWKAVMGSNPSSFKESNKQAKGLDTGRFPVESVSWFDCLEFCNKLSEKEGLKPRYESTDIERFKDEGKGQIRKAKVKVLAGDGYHLPTYPEWAHACRAGGTTRYFWGDRDEDMNDYGWYDENSEMRPHGVGEKKPNAFGLHDTHGNVREWIYEMMPQGDASLRTQAAGGSFHYKHKGCEVAAPRWHGAHDRISFVGLRLAKAASMPDQSKPSPPPAAEKPKGLRVASALMVHGAEIDAIVTSAGIAAHKRSDLYFGSWHGFVGGTVEDLQERHRAPIAKGDIDVLVVATWSWSPNREVWHNRVGLDSALAGVAELGLKNNPNFRVCWRTYLQPRTTKKDGKLVPDFAATRKALEADAKALEALVEAVNKKHGKRVVQIVPHAEAGLKLVDLVAAGKFPGVDDPADLWMTEESFNMNVHRHLRALSAYCDYAAMYRVSPVGLKPSFDGITYRSKGGKDHSMAGLTAEQHAILQRIAWETVSAHPHAGVADAVKGTQDKNTK